MECPTHREEVAGKERRGKERERGRVGPGEKEEWAGSARFDFFTNFLIIFLKNENTF